MKDSCAATVMDRINKGAASVSLIFQSASKSVTRTSKLFGELKFERFSFDIATKRLVSNYTLSFINGPLCVLWVI